MARRKNQPTLPESESQLREEVASLRGRVSELEASVKENQNALTTLQEREQLYRTIVENIAPITYAVAGSYEPLNSALYVSPHIEKILGHAAAEFLKDPLLWMNTIYSEDRKRVMAASDQADVTGGPLDVEYRVVSNRNEIAWFHDQSVLVKDGQGQPLCRVGILIDVTERKQAELALRRLEDIYHRAIDAAGAVPYVVNHAGRWQYQYLGEGIDTLTGYSADEMTADLWDSLRLSAIPRGRLAALTFEEADRLTNEDHSVLWECDFQIRTRAGQVRWIADTSVKSFDEKSGRLLSIGIYQDITDRKLAEEVRENLIEELEQRNAELERLAYTLSHELKSPLITIRGFMGYLHEDAVSGNLNRLERDFQRISEGTEKMLRLINELIDLMSVGRLNFELQELSLRVAVDEALEATREEIIKKNISVQIADDLPIVFGDRKRLLEVFQILIGNSVKFMREQPEPRIEIGQRHTTPTPTFYVRDNGLGIDRRFHERIFGIFQKLDAHTEGTGIGLALVKRIIEIHGGRIWVESEGLGQGSAFCFTLPDTRRPNGFK